MSYNASNVTNVRENESVLKYEYVKLFHYCENKMRVSLAKDCSIESMRCHALSFHAVYDDSTLNSTP